MAWNDRHGSRRRRSDPSKDSPRLQPHHVTVTVAFLSFDVPRLLRVPSNPLPGSSLFAFTAGTPTSRRCSAGESVTSSRRCRRFDALSSLGLCPPSRSFLAVEIPILTTMCNPFPNWARCCASSAPHSPRAAGRALTRTPEGDHEPPRRSVTWNKAPEGVLLIFHQPRLGKVSNRASREREVGSRFGRIPPTVCPSRLRGGSLTPKE
jgi:hypothetical protein